MNEKIWPQCQVLLQISEKLKLTKKQKILKSSLSGDPWLGAVTLWCKQGTCLVQDARFSSPHSYNSTQFPEIEAFGFIDREAD